MPKRNFTLLIIIIVIVIAIFFAFLYSSKRTGTTGGDSGGTNFFSDLNPFGQNKPANPSEDNTQEVSNYVPPSPQEIQQAKLRKVSSIPVAGFGLFTKERFKDVPVVTPPVVTKVPEGGITPSEQPVAPIVPKKATPPPTELATAVRYVDKITGNIYQTFADKIEERKFSSTFIPQVYEASFGSKAESVIMRYLKSDGQTIETFAGALPKEPLGADEAKAKEIKGVFLPQNISDISFSPDLLKIFYILNTDGNGTGTTSGILGEKKVQVFSSPFSEWLSYWPTNSTITLTTKPSSGVPGYMYSINPSTRSFTKILSSINGLTTLASPDGKYILYSDNNMALKIYNVKSKSYTSLPVNTMAEKCVWPKISGIIYCAVPRFPDSASYPDDWYKGKVSFSDEIWKIDVVNGNGSIILDPISSPGGEDMDATKLALDKDENYLFMVNKKDSYLWEFNLK